MSGTWNDAPLSSAITFSISRRRLFAPTPPTSSTLVFSAMCQCPFGYFDAHGKCSLLEAVTDILDRRPAFLRCAYKAGECQVHSFHGIRQLNVTPFSCECLDDRPAGVGEPFCPGKLVQGIAKPDIKGFTKNAVPGFQVPDYLGICPAGIQGDRVTTARCISSYLDMRNTMVYPDKRDTKRQG